MSHKKGPGFLLGKSSSSNLSGSATSSPGEVRTEALQTFQRRFREVNPLMIKAMNRTGTRSPKDTLAGLVKVHQETLSRISKSLGYQSVDSMPDPDRFLLSKAVSDCMLGSDSLKGFKTAVGRVTTFIKTSINDKARTGFFNSSKDDAFLSSHAISNVKINAIKPNLDFSRTLSGLGVSDEEKEFILEQQVSIAASMAKDICFNHDSNATLWDREKLFVSLIGPCMDSVSDSWVHLYVEKYDYGIRSFNSSKVSELLVDTRVAIEQDDMGHAERLPKTMTEISDCIFQLIEAPKDISISRNARLAYIGRQISVIDRELAKAWERAVSEIQDEVSKLSEEELEVWIQNEGSQPMDLSKLWSNLSEDVVNKVLDSSERIDIDNKDLAGQSFFRLIQSWGLTDTLCKVKR